MFFLAKIIHPFHIIFMHTCSRPGKKANWRLIGCLCIVLAIGCPTPGFSGDAAKQQVTLEQAVVCASLSDLEPVNPALAFPIANGRITCYTRFSGISRETYIQHRWYRKDELVTEKNLLLKPPQWATYSSIQLRETDKGLWRIEIVSPADRVFDILRFSVTE